MPDIINPGVHEHRRGPDNVCLDCRMMLWQKEPDQYVPMGEYPEIDLPELKTDAKPYSVAHANAYAAMTFEAWKRK